MALCVSLAWSGSLGSGAVWAQEAAVEAGDPDGAEPVEAVDGMEEPAERRELEAGVEEEVVVPGGGEPAGESEEEEPGSEAGEVPASVDPETGEPEPPLEGEPEAEPGSGQEPGGEPELSPSELLGRGVLRVEVYDAESGSALQGVSVLVTETGMGGLTSAQGVVQVDIVEGSYTVLITETGYRIETIEGIEVLPRTTKTVRRGLERRAAEEEDAIWEMERFVVVAELVEGGTEVLLLDRRELAGLANLIGADEISRLALGDVAAAASKIVGVNIVDGRYAVIRGLGDRYSATTLNGALIPSADPSKKAVQLDLIPTHLVDNLAAVKTFTPDISAEFAGGSVDIRTLRFPEERIIKVGAGVSYGDLVTGERVYRNPDRAMNIWGRVDDSLPPVGSPADFARGVARPTDPPSPEQVEADEVWTLLHTNGSMRPRRSTADPNQGFEVTLGDSFESKIGKLGVVLALTQDRKFQFRDEVEINRGSNNLGSFQVRQGQEEVRSDEEVTWGGLINTAVEFAEGHQIGFTLMSNNASADSITLGRRVVNDEDNTVSNPVDGNPGFVRRYNGAAARVYRSFDEIEYLDRSLEVRQLQGTHLFEDWGGLKWDWLVSGAEAEEDRPDTRFLRSFQLDYDDSSLEGYPGIGPGDLDPDRGTQLTQGNPLGGNPANSFREFLNTFEEGLNLRSDLTIPLWGYGEEKRNSELKLGFSFNDKDRFVRGRLFKYDLGSQLRTNLARDEQLGIDLQEDWDNPDRIDGSARNGNAIYFTDLTRAGNTVRNVDAASEISAGYVMGTAHYDRWRIVGGVRFESEDRGFEVIRTLNSTDQADALNAKLGGPGNPIRNEYALPSIGLDYTFGEDDQHAIRLAYGRTVARPTFYEFAPIRTVDQTDGLEVRGNEELVDTVIDNFDVRWEWYPKADEIVSLSLFWKEMDQPIVTTVGTTANSGFYRSWENSPAGTLRGVEIEYRKYFFENWLISTNLTYIDSMIDPLETASGATGSATIFEGQPEWIFNLIFGYDNPDWGFNANLIYNFTDDILTDVSADPNVPNIFREAVHTLDFVMSKEFKNGLTLKFSARNLLDSDFRKFYEGQDLDYEEYSPGRTFAIGASWDF
ncbi:MAG TPA: outer membrane beta-barrel protein [Verrucomicrobiales bacterium]|nr:outer membrane beta-barrel protein [Verrucomicrobiales bacterium]